MAPASRWTPLNILLTGCVLAGVLTLWRTHDVTYLLVRIRKPGLFAPVAHQVALGYERDAMFAGFLLVLLPVLVWLWRGRRGR